MKNLQKQLIIIAVILLFGTFCFSQKVASTKMPNSVEASKIENKSIQGKDVNYIDLSNLKNGVNIANINGNQFEITKSSKGITGIKMNKNKVSLLTRTKGNSDIGVKDCGDGICVCTGDKDCNDLLSSICVDQLICTNCWCSGSGVNTTCVCTYTKKSIPVKTAKTGGIANPPQTKKK